MAKSTKEWYVYVIQSQVARQGKRGPLPGFFYVGASTDPVRRLRQHNGEIVGGGRWTSKNRPHLMCAVYGPYPDQSSALKAERALKKGKRGTARTQWKPSDSKWCRGLGTADPRVKIANEARAATLRKQVAGSKESP